MTELVNLFATRIDQRRWFKVHPVPDGAHTLTIQWICLVEQFTRLRQQTEHVLEGLSFLYMLVAPIALVVHVATFGWLVFGRYVLNATPTWVEPLALLLICYITYLGAAVGIHGNTHLGVTIFHDMTAEKISSFLKFFIDFLLAGFGLIMMIASFILVKFGWDTLLPMLNIPESFRSLSAARCGGLVFIFAGVRAMFRVACMIDGKTYLERGEFKTWAWQFCLEYSEAAWWSACRSPLRWGSLPRRRTGTRAFRSGSPFNARFLASRCSRCSRSRSLSLPGS